MIILRDFLPLVRFVGSLSFSVVQHSAIEMLGYCL